VEHSSLENLFRLGVLRTSAIWIGGLTTIGVITRYLIAPFNFYTSAINFICGLILLSFPFWLKKKASPKVLATVFLLVISVIGASSAFGNGGIAAPAAIVFALVPVIGFLLNGRNGGITGLAFTFSTVAIVWLAEQEGLTAVFPNPDRYSTAKAFLISATSIGAYFLGRAYEKARKAVEMELINREEQIRAILESSPIAKILVDQSGNIIFLNNALNNIVTSGATSSANRFSNHGSVFDFLPSEFHPRIREELKSEIKTNQDLDIHYLFDNQIKWARVQAVKLDDGNGTRKILFTFIDVTEQKRIEEMRFAMTSNSKMAALGEMAGGVAHEINNPLSIIVGKCGTVRTLVNQPDFNREKITAELEKISSTAGRIAKITTGLLAFSRAGDQDLPGKPLIREIIEETTAFCMEKFKVRDVRLKIDYGEIGNVAITCRQSQVSQVLLNLLNNSLEEVQALSEKWVHLKVSLMEKHIEFSVTDSGHGISPTVVEKIFQPFFTTKPVGRGTGLGLSISKGIVESHGGKIEYDAKSRNTRFVFTLPLDS
jgi:PAS domain S-box-containing protein